MVALPPLQGRQRSQPPLWGRTESSRPHHPGQAPFRPGSGGCVTAAPAHGGHGGHHGHDDHGHDDHHSEGGEAPLMCVVPLCITAVGCILLFIFPEPIQDLLAPIFQGAVK